MLLDTNGIMECIEFLTGELNFLRNGLKLTQKDFAKIIGISRISLIDLGHRKPKNYQSNSYCNNFLFSLQSSTAILYTKRSFMI